MKTRFLLVAFALSLFTNTANAADASGAGKFVEALANQTLTTISNASLSKAQKQSRLENLFTGGVDIAWVGKFVMGQYWRKASNDQKSRYLKHYQTFIIRHYTSRFTDYTSGTFTITGIKDDGDNESTVSMTIKPMSNGHEPINVDYRVRKTAAGFKIFDINVEGVSMITTQRSEFASVISDHDIEHLIRQLETK